MIEYTSESTSVYPLSPESVALPKTEKGLKNRVKNIVVQLLKDQALGQANERRAILPEGMDVKKVENPKEFIKDVYKAEELSIEMEDGINLESLYVKNTKNNEKPIHEKNIIVYFGGSHLSSFYYAKQNMFLFDQDENAFDVFIPNRRGFGGSEGEPSLDLMQSDALEIIEYLKGQGYSVENISVMGYSMGSVEASHIGEHYQINTLIIDRGFSSLSDVCGDSMEKGLRKITKKVVKALHFEVDVGDKLSHFQGKHVELIRAIADKTMKKKQNDRNIKKLQDAGIDYHTADLDCDHYGDRKVKTKTETKIFQMKPELTFKNKQIKLRF